MTARAAVLRKHIRATRWSHKPATRNSLSLKPRSAHRGRCQASQSEDGTPHKEQTAEPSSRLKDALQGVTASLEGLWHKFLPMATLFFLMAFVNTILDNLKDTLIVTLAVGGSADVIAFLNVWAVLPSSLVFLAVFNRLSATMSREQLFNAIIVSFLVFIACFAFVLYPNHAALHPHAAAASWLAALPTGAAGAVCMLSNWTFSLFYCISELWGDVGLSLLFWGLANETTNIKEAPLLYPLFGIGANIAQVFAGQCLKVMGSQAGTSASFHTSMTSLCLTVIVFGVAILVLHKHIAKTHSTARAENAKDAPRATLAPRTRSDVTQPSDAATRPPAPDGAAFSSQPPSSQTGSGMSASAVDEFATTQERAVSGQHASTSAPASRNGSHDVSSDTTEPTAQNPAALGFVSAIKYCWNSQTIRCLAIMSIAQGICSNLLEYTWQKHLQLYKPDPVQYTAFKGDVASFTGVLTVGMMALAPTCFKTLGWRRTARTTPELLLYIGLPFFLACIGFHVAVTWFAPSHAMISTYLMVLSVVGAVLYVAVRAAKFSLFKPAEEMVYLSLDDRARLNGKAAVDVLGAQFGKSCGSTLQQILFLATGSASFLQLPMLAAAFAWIAWNWAKSVDELSRIVPQHTTLQSMDFDSEDEEELQPLLADVRRNDGYTSLTPDIRVA